MFVFLTPLFLFVSSHCAEAQDLEGDDNEIFNKRLCRNSNISWVVFFFFGLFSQNFKDYILKLQNLPLLLAAGTCESGGRVYLN